MGERPLPWARLDRGYYVDDDIVLARREFNYIAEVLWTRWIAYGKPIKAPQGQEGGVFATCLSFDADEAPLLAAILEWYVANGSVEATKNSGPIPKDRPRMVLWDQKNRGKYRPPERFLTRSNREGTAIESLSDSGNPQVDSESERDASSRSSSQTSSRRQSRTDVRTDEEGTSKLAATRGTRKPDPIFEALVEVMGWSLDALTTSARGQLNAAAKQLRGVDASPEAIARRADRYRREHPDWTFSPTALAKHWPDLGENEKPASNGHCDECQCGGGSHFDRCSKYAPIQAAQAESFERALEDRRRWFEGRSLEAPGDGDTTGIRYTGDALAVFTPKDLDPDAE